MSKYEEPFNFDTINFPRQRFQIPQHGYAGEIIPEFRAAVNFGVQSDFANRVVLYG